jgi:hypothetical protein
MEANLRKPETIRTLQRGLQVSVLLAMVLAANFAAAQIWIPSTGTVDDGSLTTYQFTNGAAFVRSTVNSGFAILRFNVLPVGSLTKALTQPCCEGRTLLVSYIDNGPNAQVLVSLKRYNIRTGVTTTLLKFDSNNNPQQTSFHESATNSGSFFNFSFAEGPTEGGTDLGGDSAYYIEAQLIKTAPGGNPGLASVRLVTTQSP